MNIRLHGHLSAAFGLADGAAATRRCLEAAGCAVQPCDLRLASHPAAPGDSQPSAGDGAGAVPPAPASARQPAQQPARQPARGIQLDLVHTNPNVLAATAGLLDPATLTAPLRVGFWAWELEAFPEGWEQAFPLYDEIWCPSAHCAQSLSQRSPIPVIALPHLPDWPRLDQLRQRRLQGQRQRQMQRRQSPAEPFQVLTLFDFWSTPERKNPAGVIQAFQAAFPLDERGQQPPVELLIKTSSAEYFPQARAELEQLSGRDPRIRWLHQLLSREDLDQLFCRADALVSLHRAEGFGLNLADAMAIGLPVVATAYSANLEFMPLGSAELIPWRPGRLEHDCGDYRRGQLWAEPDLAAAAASLRRLALDAPHRTALAERAATAVRERLAAERLVAIVRQRLGHLLLTPSRRELLEQQRHLPAAHG